MSCPCGGVPRGARLTACCGPVVSGERLAQTAEALMRSRYTAYALGDGDHLFRTWHPRTRTDDASPDPRVRWTGLDVLDVVDGGPDDTDGVVEFRATWVSHDDGPVRRGSCTSVAGSPDGPAAGSTSRLSSSTGTTVGRMMQARRRSAWRNDYEITADGRPLAVLNGSLWRGGGTLVVDGRRYGVRSSTWATSYTLVDDGGALVASARRIGRKDWSIDAGGLTYAFRRSSMWSMEQQHVVQGMPMGSIRRTSAWRGDAVADLPGLPALVALFAVTVVLTTWDVAAAST